MPRHCVAFWNVENLFGPENHQPRIDWVATAMASDLAGFTPQLYQRKLSQLVKIIAQMKDGEGPDILGMCEVEDRAVLEDLVVLLSTELPGRNYGIVHSDNELDSRGINTAFLFDMAAFTVDPNLVFNHFVMRRTGTRDILQATFHSLAGNDLIVMANHWPSRYGSGDPAATAGFRATAGETLAYWHERIREELGKDSAILALGDFNDEPWDHSLKHNANSWRERGDVERARSAKFYNFTWEYQTTRVIDSEGNDRDLDGTLYYKSNGNLFDQILAARPLLDSSATPFKIVEGSVGVVAFPEMVSPSSGEGPIRFGLPKGDAAKNVNQNGFSDHFPVAVLVEEVMVV